MANTKQYRVTDKVGVVGFSGVIHKTGDVINASDVPPANLKAWIRFGQVEEVTEEAAAAPTADANDEPATGEGTKQKKGGAK